MNYCGQYLFDLLALDVDHSMGRGFQTDNRNEWSGRPASEYAAFGQVGLATWSQATLGMFGWDVNLQQAMPIAEGDGASQAARRWLDRAESIHLPQSVPHHFSDVSPGPGRPPIPAQATFLGGTEGRAGQSEASAAPAGQAVGQSRPRSPSVPPPPATGGPPFPHDADRHPTIPTVIPADIPIPADEPVAAPAFGHAHDVPGDRPETGGAFPGLIAPSSQATPADSAATAGTVPPAPAQFGTIGGSSTVPVPVASAAAPRAPAAGVQAPGQARQDAWANWQSPGTGVRVRTGRSVSPRRRARAADPPRFAGQCLGQEPSCQFGPSDSDVRDVQFRGMPEHTVDPHTGQAGFKVFVGDLPSFTDAATFMRWVQDSPLLGAEWAVRADLHVDCRVARHASSGCARAICTVRTEADATRLYGAVWHWWAKVPRSLDRREWRWVTVRFFNSRPGPGDDDF